MNAPQTAWPAIRTPAQHFIGNRWRDALSGAELPMVDPSDGAPFAAIARGNAADVDAAVSAASHAYCGAWGKIRAAERDACSPPCRAILEHADELALIEARDCGADHAGPRRRRGPARCPAEFYGGACDKLRSATLPSQGFTVLTWREPHGVTSTSFRGTIRCRSSGARSAGRSRRAMHASIKPAEDACLSLCASRNSRPRSAPAAPLNIVTGIGRRRARHSPRASGIARFHHRRSPATGAWVAAAGRDIVR